MQIPDTGAVNHWETPHQAGRPRSSGGWVRSRGLLAEAGMSMSLTKICSPLPPPVLPATRGSPAAGGTVGSAKVLLDLKCLEPVSWADT